MVRFTHRSGCLITQRQGSSDFAWGSDDPCGFCYQGLARKTLSYCLSFTCIRHYFPRHGRQDWTAVGTALREFHPSEDLSELPPLLETVAGQGYHCRRTRALQDSLPRLLLDGRVPLSTFSLGPLIEASREKCSPFLIPWLLQVVLARPPHRFPLSKARPLTLSSCRV